MATPEIGCTNHPVEVSGWDAAENFFVENAVLEWREDGTKMMFLRTPLQEGAIVFIRLAHTFEPSTNIPLAYQVASIGNLDSTGRAPLTLTQLRPRRPREKGMPLG